MRVLITMPTLAPPGRPAGAADDRKVKAATGQVERRQEDRRGQVGGVEQTAKGVGKTVTKARNTAARS